MIQTRREMPRGVLSGEKRGRGKGNPVAEVILFIIVIILFSPVEVLNGISHSWKYVFFVLFQGTANERST